MYSVYGSVVGVDRRSVIGRKNGEWNGLDNMGKKEELFKIFKLLNFC